MREIERVKIRREEEYKRESEGIYIFDIKMKKKLEYERYIRARVRKRDIDR